MTERAEVRWLRVNGRRVRTLEAGAGLPIVIVPGLGLSANFYRRNIEALAATGAHVIGVDPPGFGWSEASDWTGMEPADAGAWLRGFAGARGLERAVWIGHSASCQPLLELAARSPDRTRALVLAAPTAVRTRRHAAAQLLMIAPAAFRESVPLIRTLARDYVRASPLRYVGTWVRSARHDALDVATRVRCPCLVVRGGRDLVARGSTVAPLAGALPGARLVTIPEGAHGLPFDAAAAFDREVAAFLRELS